ncbi:MAG: tRNA pseudouridine(55) synthase TruB [Anaerorhabdus sp.]
MDGVFYINKPKGMTSFDVVAKLRKQIHQKSIGHTGTLDPNAEGLLIVLVGKACKALPYCNHDQKEYIAQLSFGKKTTTGDRWGDVVEERKVTAISREALESVLQSFIGESFQQPPMTSAIKVNGKKLLEYQREGKVVQVKPRKIRIDHLTCLAFDGFSATIKAIVTQGTYIRVLCEDIAEKTGNIGTMTELCRTMIGPISLDQAEKIEDITEKSTPHPITEILQGTLPMFESDKINEIKQGKRLFLNSTEELVLLTHQNEVVAAYEKVEGNEYRCRRGLW